MKKMRLILCSVVCVMLISGLFPILEITADVQDTEGDDPGNGSTYYQQGSWLLTTRWRGSWYPYKNHTPEQNGEHIGLGCGTTAIAQILRYHELQSYGIVKRGTNLTDPLTGDQITVESDLDDHQYVWPLLVDTLLDDDGTIIENNCYIKLGIKICPEHEAVSTFLFDVALVIGRKFGKPGNTYFTNAEQKVQAIQKYFYHVTADSYYLEIEDITALNSIEYADHIKKIKDEIDQYRPVYLSLKGIRLSNDKEVDHAVVIDGYRYTFNFEFEVHLNFGWNGIADGWYVYDQPIETEQYLFDADFRQLLIFRVDTPYERMSDIIFIVRNYETGNWIRDLAINQAYNHLLAISDSNYWIGDGLHLDPDEGFQVFINTSFAAAKLGSVYYNNYPWFTSSTAPLPFKKIQNRLASIPAILAKIALHEANEAKKSGVQNWWNRPIVDELLANAEREMDFAEDKREDKRYEMAIWHFGNAWKLAQRAKTCSVSDFPCLGILRLSP